MTEEEKIKILIEALEFYASTKNWERPHNEYGNALKNSIIMNDGGEIARSVIRKVEKSD